MKQLFLIWSLIFSITGISQTTCEYQFKSDSCSLSLAKTKELVDWYPAVDIHEDNNGFYLDVEAPGVSKDQFDVKVQDGVLTIRGERKHEEEKKDKNIYRSERMYGRFERSFTLPPVADSAKIEAEYKNGVLALKIPKKEVAKPAQIEVKVKE